MKASKQEWIFILIMYLFTFQFGLMKCSAVFQFLDELYAAICIPLFFLNFNGRIKQNKSDRFIRYMIMAIFIFLLIGIAANSIYAFQSPLAIVQDIFLNLKFYMGIVTTYYLFKNFKFDRSKHQICFHCKLLIVLFLLLTLQNKITHIYSVADMRFGINAEKIFFNHPTELASTTFFLLLILIMSSDDILDNKQYVLMAVFTIILTLRFKAIATTMLFIYMYFIVMSGRKMHALYLLPLVPFVVAVAGKEFYFYFFSDATMQMARGALSYTSLKIAKDFFPFGTGFGTFASWMSGVYYSPLYESYGISDVWGLGKGWPALVSDVFWPMIIAQNGYIGFVLYVVIIWCLYKIIMQCAKTDRTIFLAGMGALSYLLISSIAESAFVNPLALPLSLVIGMCICISKQKSRGTV